MADSTVGGLPMNIRTRQIVSVAKVSAWPERTPDPFSVFRSAEFAVENDFKNG